MADAIADMVRQCTHCGTPAEPPDTACQVCGQEQFQIHYECRRCHQLLATPICPRCWKELSAADRLLFTARAAGNTGLACARRLLAEARAVSAATWQQTVRLWRYAHGWLRCQVLGRRALQTQFALGQRMVDAGIGEECFRERIAELTQRLRSLNAARGAMKAWLLERNGLVLALAARALVPEQAVPGEIHTEHRLALEAQQILLMKCDETGKARTVLFAWDRSGGQRVALGYGVVCLLILLVLIRIR